MHQHGLTLIVGVVSYGDARGACGSRDLGQEGIAHATRRFLDGQFAFAGNGGHIARFHRARDAPAGSQVGHEPGVGVGVGPANEVIQVGGVYLDAQLVATVPQQMEQTERIGPARHADDGAPAGSSPSRWIKAITLRFRSILLPILTGGSDLATAVARGPSRLTASQRGCTIGPGLIVPHFARKRQEAR